MIELYANGKRLGTWAESEELFAEAIKHGPVEFRDETGAVLNRTIWEPSKEELDRRSEAGGGKPLAEFWREMGEAPPAG